MPSGIVVDYQIQPLQAAGQLLGDGEESRLKRQSIIFPAEELLDRGNHGWVFTNFAFDAQGAEERSGCLRIQIVATVRKSNEVR